jgi:hypothetical protein
MQDQWEYKTLLPGWKWIVNFVDLQGTSYGPFCEEMLNKLGKDGWEYCSNFGNILTFKRRIAP